MEEFNWQDTVARAINGDKSAFEQLYKKTERSVYFTCIKLLGNEHDAQDIMQETYIQAYEKLSDLKDYSKFQSWINRIAANNCKMFFRKPVDESIEDRLIKGDDISAEREFIPSEYIENVEKRRIMMDIIDTKLSDVQRQTIILYYYVEMSVAEIAETMDCPEGTVKYRLVAAREKIKEVILDYEKESGDRLHAVIPVVVLTEVLRRAAEETIVPAVSVQVLGAAVSSSGKSTAKNSVTKAVRGGSKKMLKTVRAKVIAGVAGVALIGGIIAVGVVLSGGNSDGNADENGGVVSENKNGATDNNGGNSSDGSNNGSSDGTTDGVTDGSNEADSSTEFTKLPSYELIVDSLYEISDIGTTYTKDNYGYGDAEYKIGLGGAYTNVSGTIRWGEYYSPQDYKPFVAYKQLEADFAYATRFYVGTTTVAEPYNDKNIMFVRDDSNYHIEIPNTGDVTKAFLAADDVTLVCISKSAVKAFSTEDGSKLWEVSSDIGAYFASGLTAHSGFKTDWKKMIIDMYTENDGKYEYYDSMIIDLSDGSGKKLAVSGVFSDNDRLSNKDALKLDNEKITSEWEICGDKYLGMIGTGRHGADVWVIVDDNGEILLSTDVYEGTILPVKDDEDWKEQYYVDEVFVLGTGHFVVYTRSGSFGDDRICTILDNDLSVVKEFTPSSLDELSSSYLVGESQTIFAGDNSYGCTGSFALGNSQVKQMHLAFDKDLNVIPGFNIELFGHNGYIFTQYLTFPEGTQFRYNAVNNVMNIYTGKTLEGYSLIDLTNGMPGSQGDVAFTQKDKIYYFFNADFNQLYEVPSDERVTEWANYEGSKYFAYVTSAGVVYGIDKSTKEVVKIKDADEEKASDYDIMVNGDFVIYTAKNSTELHGYNMETGEDSIIFKTESETDKIKVSEDKRQNNWFYVCTDYNAEDKKYESYEAYALK